MAAALALGLAVMAAAPALAQGRDDDDSPGLRPLDLTRVAPAASDTDGDDGRDNARESRGSRQITVATGLRARKPSSVRLASLGLDRPPQDGLDRLMWGKTNADNAMALFARLPGKTASPTLRRQLEYVMLARAVPPGSTTDHAEALVEMRLRWLASEADAGGLADLVRQLPDQEPWLDWKRWLVLHDLINRNDIDGCDYASNRVASTLESIWHQINIFCQVVGGDVGQASFALDILADSGVDDPAYFALMDSLTGRRGDAVLPADAPIGPLNLVLMDSARVEISSAALQSAGGHRTSIDGLRYLGEDAQILIGARRFEQTSLPVGEVIADWAVLPVANVPASEALTRLTVAETGDEIALARLFVWQAVALETDKAAASDLAMRALAVDFDHGGIRSLELWVPFIDAGEADDLKALVPNAGAGAGSPEAAAWTRILGDSTGRVAAADLVSADAVDAVPVLRALERPVTEFEWHDQIAEQRALAPGGTALRFGHLLALEASADAGNKAETLLTAAVALGPAKPWHLGRDDAARLVDALMRAGLEETARGLAREIITGWVLARHFAGADGGDGASG